MFIIITNIKAASPSKYLPKLSVLSILTVSTIFDSSSDCKAHLPWTLNDGIYNWPQYYPNFYATTGVALLQATETDMLLYWACANNGHPDCQNGQIAVPCNRNCLSPGFNIYKYIYLSLHTIKNIIKLYI